MIDRPRTPPPCKFAILCPLAASCAFATQDASGSAVIFVDPGSGFDPANGCSLYVKKETP